MVIRFSQRKNSAVRYFIDTGWTEHHCCTHKLPTICANEFEKIITEHIKEKIETLGIKAKEDTKDNEIQNNIYRLQFDIEKINNVINSLVDSIATGSADNITITYINKRITDLDKSRIELVNKIDDLKEKQEKTAHIIMNN